MAIKAAINGYGRIGRNIMRALYKSDRTGEIQVMATKDLGDPATNVNDALVAERIAQLAQRVKTVEEKQLTKWDNCDHGITSRRRYIRGSRRYVRSAKGAWSGGMTAATVDALLA